MGALEAKLPCGPAQKVCYDDSVLEGISNDEKYKLFLSRMEAEVRGLLGKEGKALEALMGRTEGPVFVQRCALGDDVGGARKTSSTSRAWRKSAGWLTDVIRARNLVEAKMCKRKLMTYSHPPPDEFKAPPQQIESFAKFKVWQGTISGGLLANESWAFALRNMAAVNAEREERMAQQISMAKWVSWIREGPAHGLRRQHRFTRNVAGWVPTEKNTGGSGRCGCER